MNIIVERVAALKTLPADRAVMERTRARILPREAGAVSLDLVIGVMAFLAALALGAVLIAERTAQSWQAGLAGRITIQILPQGAAPPESEVEAALKLLRSTAGIARAAPLSDSDNLALIEPFLGRDPVVAALPFPRLIDVELAPGATLDLAALERQLKTIAPHSVLDDHGRWIARLRSTANTVVLGVLAVLALIAVGTAATVAFATRAGLATHHEIVELLHLMGAQDRFIARAFEWHYFLAAAVASIGGAALAAFAFLMAGGLDQIGVTAVSFLPPLGLSWGELPWLLLVPAAASVISWATARISVIAALHEFY
jgi:cell division transport system permease protein